MIQDGSYEDTATISSQLINEKSMQDMTILEKPPMLVIVGPTTKPSMPKGLGEYPNPFIEKWCIRKAEKIAYDCQAKFECQLKESKGMDTIHPNYIPSRPPNGPLNILEPITEEGPMQGADPVEIPPDPHLHTKRLACRIITQSLNSRVTYSKRDIFLQMQHERDPYIKPSNLHKQTQMDNPSAPKDIASLNAFLFMEIKMPIATLLQGCPTLWKDLSDWMNGHLSNDAPHETESLLIAPPQSTHDISALNNANIPKVPVNRLGDYCESEHTNATIPIAYQHHRFIAILDGGARANIITKQSWEAWGRLEFETNTFMVKLVDGTVAKQVGIVRDVSITTFCLILMTFLCFDGLQKKSRLL